MRLLLKIAALAASTIAFIASLSIGGFLAGVEETGARGAGVLLVFAALLAFAAALFVVVASGRVRRGAGRLVMPLAAVLAIVPVAAISGVALFFSGNPIGSASPYLDWGSFAAGLLLAIGGVSIAALAVAPARMPLPAPSPAPEQSQGFAPAPTVLSDDVAVRTAGSRPGGAEV